MKDKKKKKHAVENKQTKRAATGPRGLPPPLAPPSASTGGGLGGGSRARSDELMRDKEGLWDGRGLKKKKNCTVNGGRGGEEG